MIPPCIDQQLVIDAEQRNPDPGGKPGGYLIQTLEYQGHSLARYDSSPLALWKNYWNPA